MLQARRWQPIGQLDQQNADVARDGDQELAEVLGLLGFGDEVELLDLGEAIDESADLLAELLVDLGAGDVGVLDHVVQQGGRMVASSSLSSVRIAATSRGWEKKGSPEARFWCPCACMA